MNRDQIKSLLLSSDRAVERAMVALLERQTVGEQDTSTTQHLNGVGFSAFHAKSGSDYAKWVKSGRRLTGPYLAKARKMAVHYVGQLEAISQARLGDRRETHTVSDMGSALALFDPFFHQG